MIPWAVGSGLYDGLLAFGVAVGALVVACLVLEVSFLVYDRVCFWLQERERRR